MKKEKVYSVGQKVYLADDFIKYAKPKINLLKNKSYEIVKKEIINHPNDNVDCTVCKKVHKKSKYIYLIKDCSYYITSCEIKENIKEKIDKLMSL